MKLYAVKKQLCHLYALIKAAQINFSFLNKNLVIIKA